MSSRCIKAFYILPSAGGIRALPQKNIYMNPSVSNFDLWYRALIFNG